MPEGPELHLAAQLINSICKNRLFAGKVRRNPIHKCADVDWDDPCYKISAVSRGKELKVFLQSHREGREEDGDSKIDAKNAIVEKRNSANGGKSMQVLFNFGMSGKFEFTSAAELPKHAHLSFFTKSEPSMALSFVDYRRFGKWQVGADWSADRGPCVLFEYPLFRSNVLQNLNNPVFNKPLCEVLLNQKYFNGIGNYLRAEIIYRAGVRPFEQARTVLVTLPDVPSEVKVKIEEFKPAAKVKVKGETADILELCNQLPQEVVGLGTTLYLPEDDHDDISKFSRWLRCYYKPGMKNIADHNKRTMWYHGDPGPLAPREGKSGGSKKRSGVYNKKLAKTSKKLKSESSEIEDDDKTETTETSSDEKPHKRGRTARVTRAALEKDDAQRKQPPSKKKTVDQSIGKQTTKSRKRGASKELSFETEENFPLNTGEKAVGKKAVKRKAQKAGDKEAGKLLSEPEAKKPRSRKRMSAKNEIETDIISEPSAGKQKSRVTRGALVKEEVNGRQKRTRK